MPADATASSSALTLLSEEEMMFRDAVAAFADEEVRPRVMEMEQGGEDRSRAASRSTSSSG